MLHGVYPNDSICVLSLLIQVNFGNLGTVLLPRRKLLVYLLNFKFILVLVCDGGPALDLAAIGREAGWLVEQVLLVGLLTFVSFGVDVDCRPVCDFLV